MLMQVVCVESVTDRLSRFEKSHVLYRKQSRAGQARSTLNQTDLDTVREYDPITYCIGNSPARSTMNQTD
jgi:hypothetical protein